MSWLTNESLLEAARGTAGAAVNWWIQAALLISAGLAVGALSRKRGSAVQSAVYRTTLAAVIAAPLVTWALNCAGVQGWSVEMPQAWSLVDMEYVPEVDDSIAADSPSWAAIGNEALASMRTSNEPPARSQGFVAMPVMQGEQTAAIGTDQTNPSPALASPSLPAPAPPAQVPADAAPVFAIHRFGVIAAVVSAVWALVAAVIVIRLAVAWRRLGQIRRRALPADVTVQNACRELAARLGVAPPAVLHSPYLPSPCLTGLRRPAVLLPELTGELPLRDVLAHELAHLSRGDCYWNLLRQLAGAALFFQPLMWLLSRRLEATAEEVCDDYVVHLGGDRRGYAHRLVDIAELSLAPFAPAGVGIVSLRSMLGQRVARIMDTSRSLSTRVGGALLALVLMGGLLGTLAAGLVGLSESASAVTGAEEGAVEEAVTDDGADAAETDDDVVTVRGQVVDPDGKPMPNVDVYALRWYWNFGDRKPLATTKADADGRFAISYRKSQFAETAGRPNQWREVYIASFAEGFGPGWAHYDRLKPGEEATVKLAVDDVPIEGRVIDLEGNPVAGATIELGSIAEPNADTLDEYIAAISAGQAISTAYSTMDETLPHHSTERWSNLTTDAEGRFRLTGIGRERLLDLHVSGPTIVTTTLRVATRRMTPIVHPAYAYENADDTTQYGAEFEFTAAPSRAIEGVVRDAETGAPLAGAEVWSWKFAGEDISGITTIKTRSDENGRYQLAGMPKGEGNRLVVVPTDLPYFTVDFDVPNPPGSEPVALDLDLHRGVWVTGRVTDKATGRGVAAQMHYLAFPDNKLAHELREFEQGAHEMLVQDRFRTDKDGNYRVVALPGHGIVAVNTSLQPYPGGQGFQDIKGAEDRESFMKLNGVFAPTEKFPTAVKEITAGENAAENSCDFQLDPGGRMALRTVDPQGMPLSGAQVTGVSELGGYFAPMESAEFDLVCFRPGENRTVLLHHSERRLGKALRVKLEDARDGPLTVTLEPLGQVTGTLVKDGVPVAGAGLRFDVAGDNDYGRELRRCATDADGRFRHEEVLPGLKYSIHAEGADMEFATVAKELEVQPGETVDLGTIDIAEDERPEPMRSGGAAEPATAAAVESTEKEKHVVGVVVGPDGEPVAGATVLAAWVVALEAPPTERHEHKVVAKVVSGADGQFELSVPVEPPSAPANYGWHVVAFKPGLGPAWLRDAQLATNASPTLQLTRDVPVHGRVLDLEGRPVARVAVQVRDLRPTQSEEAIANWIKESQEKPVPDPMEDRFYASGDERFAGHFPSMPENRGLASGSPALPDDVRTDSDGRFSFAGLGGNRLMLLEFAGSTIAKTVLPVVTRDMRPLAARQLHTAAVRTGTFYGSEFEYVAGPTQPIVGVLADAESGEPIVDMKVRIAQFAGDPMGMVDFLATRTDAQGRYRLVGAPVGGGHRIVADPEVDDPYFPQEQELPTVAAGDDEVAGDMSLHRGRWIVGRVSDSDSGAPIENASVEFLPLRTNKHATDYAYFRPEITGSAPTDRFKTDADGRFRVLAIPGPGVLTGIAPGESREEFCTLGLSGAPKHLIADNGYTQTYLPWTATHMHALRELDVDDAASESTCDMEFARGLKRVVKLVDADGQPVVGVQVLGRLFPPNLEKPLAESTVTIVGLRSGAERDVVFLHAERRLGKALNLTAGDEATIVLEPCAVARGRVVDEDGSPIVGLSVGVSIEHPDNWGRSLLRTSTDADGRFEALLPPGTVCRVSHYTMSGPNFFAQCEPQPGAVFELGDLADDVELTTEQTEKMMVAATAAIPPTAQGVATASAGEAKTEAEAQHAETLASRIVVRGRVVGVDGKPVAGADVAVTAMRIKPRLGGDLSPNGDVLAEAKTDANGAFEMSLVGASSKTHQYPMLVVRSAGAALGWQKLDLEAPATDAVISLPSEAPVVLRLVDIEGQPAAGTRVTVTMVTQRSLLAGLFGTDGAGFRGERAPAAWFPALTADAEGRIEIPHLAANYGTSLQVAGDERFAPQEIAVNTGMEEQRGERDATYRSLVVNNVGSDGAASVPLAPAQLFTGTVTYEDTGEPAPHARLTVWASQQEMGSMSSVAGVADEMGRFRISPNPGIRFGVNAYPQEGAPYLVRSVEQIAWKGGDKSREVNVKLPRGVLVRGQVLERGTNKPVAGASVQYVPERANNPHAKDDIVTGWQGMLATDAAGNFQMAVLPGPGRILVHGPDGQYVLHETSGQELFRGTAGGARNYASAIERIDPAPDSEPLEPTISIDRGEKVRGELVDATGAPVDQAVMVTRLTIRSFWLSWHGQPVDIVGGRFEIGGLHADDQTPVHFLDPRRKLGTTFLARAGMEPQRVVLEPCGKAAMRFVDDDGKPVDGYEPNFQFVVTPGVHEYSKMAREAGELAADADFLANVDRFNHDGYRKTGADGKFELAALIPGATYRIVGYRDGEWHADRDFVAESGKTLELGDIVVQPQER